MATNRGEFAAGWRVVLASLIGICFGLSPLPFYTLGIFAPEFVRAFHWGMGEIMGGITVTTAAVLIGGPIVGALSDRFGVRRVALSSVVLFGFAFMGLGLQTGSLVLYYATWAALAFLGVGTLPITWTRAINNWFDTNKGLALGIALTGTGLSGFLVKPLAAALVAHVGWRLAYVLLGALPILIAFPTTLLLFHDNVAAEIQRRGAGREMGLSYGESVRDWRFWLIGIAFLPIAFAVGGSIPNMENILTTHGLARSSILAVVPFIGLSVIVGRLAGGWLIDRFWAPGIAPVLLSLPAVSSWIIVHAPVTQETAFAAVVCIGLAAGVEYDLLSFLVARYFGTRNYGAVYGTMYAFFALGAGIGPLVYGHLFEATRSYDGILMMGSISMIAGGLLLLGLGRYRYFAGAAMGPTTLIEPAARAG